MGAPIARALCEAGCAVAVFNRTAAKAEALAAGCPGMTVAASAAEAAAGADMVVPASRTNASPPRAPRGRFASCPTWPLPAARA